MTETRKEQHTLYDRSRRQKELRTRHVPEGGSQVGAEGTAVSLGKEMSQGKCNACLRGEASVVMQGQGSGEHGTAVGCGGQRGESPT